MCLFICEFSIRGPKYWDISTANNEAYLYFEKKMFKNGDFKIITLPNLT